MAGAEKKLPPLQAVEKKPEADATGRLPVQKTYKLYINGAFPRTESGRFVDVKNHAGDRVANISLASRKDLRDAVTSGRGAFESWSLRAPFNRGQILYRIAEVLESRKAQFVEELELAGGLTSDEISLEVHESIERLVYYAGWSDKYQQLYSSVNPVSSSHFNFSILEPMGVVGIFPRSDSSLLGVVSSLAPVICGGNVGVVLAPESFPLSSVTFAEVLHASDVPAGVVNILTGNRAELLPHMVQHMDVNAIVYSDLDESELGLLAEGCGGSNVKRAIPFSFSDLLDDKAQGPDFIERVQEVKTTWHPIGQ